MASSFDLKNATPPKTKADGPALSLPYISSGTNQIARALFDSVQIRLAKTVPNGGLLRLNGRATVSDRSKIGVPRTDREADLLAPGGLAVLAFTVLPKLLSQLPLPPVCRGAWQNK